MAAAAASSMDRITQWVSSQDVVAADLTVRIADSVFPLHKSVMAPKCGYIRRALAAGEVELDLSALPGGAAAFEKAARFCYGGGLDLTPRDAAPLRCAAAFLDAPDLARRADDFLAHAALRSLPSAVAVLRSCDGAEEDLLVGAAADELGLARRAADAVALAVCNEALFPTTTTRPWADELGALSPPAFKRVVTALRCRRAAPEVLSAAVTAYADRVLGPGFLAAPSPATAEQRALLEAVVDALPPPPAGGGDAPLLPAAFLCRLLRAAAAASASANTCRDMELRVAAVLDHATPADLLSVALSGDRVTNADTLRRVITAFFDLRHHQRAQQTHSSARRTSMAAATTTTGASAATTTATAIEKVVRTVDEAAAELAAADPTLPISKFVGVVGSVPRELRRGTHDGVYRAVDVYLKAHPGLDEIEREKVCGAMDPLRLSHQARLHAAQNKRLPLQAVLSALYYDQLKLRSGDCASDGGGGNGDCGGGGWETRSEAGKARAQARADVKLARENEELRTELARMRAYVTGMQQNSRGSGSSAAMVPAAAAGKKVSFFGSVTRTLSRLNPFKGGGVWAKDTASIADGGGRDLHVVKAKRRRFSIG